MPCWASTIHHSSKLPAWNCFMADRAGETSYNFRFCPCFPHNFQRINATHRPENRIITLLVLFVFCSRELHQYFCALPGNFNIICGALCGFHSCSFPWLLCMRLIRFVAFCSILRIQRWRKAIYESMPELMRICRAHVNYSKSTTGAPSSMHESSEHLFETRVMDRMKTLNDDIFDYEFLISLHFRLKFGETSSFDQWETWNNQIHCNFVRIPLPLCFLPLLCTIVYIRRQPACHPGRKRFSKQHLNRPVGLFILATISLVSAVSLLAERQQKVTLAIYLIKCINSTDQNANIPSLYPITNR